MMRGKAIMALAAVCAVSTGMTTTVYAADTTFEMRRKVVSLLGILTTSSFDTNVTRQEFARMLVSASEYHDMAKATSNVAVFADVSSTGEYASDIRTVASNDWMSGYLGGNFKPEEPVSMRDAIRATLALLGYTSADFSGNLQESRRAKFSSLGLDSNIYRSDDEVLTREDCINLFYNLMKANTKNGGVYGSQVFELTFNADGEVNTSSILDNSLVGPKSVNNSSRNLDDIVPFSLDKATMFLNGELSDEGEINDSADVVYYHEGTKMIFAYSSDGETKGATKGRIKAIYYDSNDPFTPVRVVLNTYNQDYAEDGDEFVLSTTEIQYLFSVYGEYGIDDDVLIVWESSGAGENMTYTVVDVAAY